MSFIIVAILFFEPQRIEDEYRQYELYEAPEVEKRL
tara:strand:- start:995 stop:1102 length:108 start_codon:yes stop_codon:yes gene_type:complete